MISGNKKVPFATISTMLFQIPMRKQGVKMSCSGDFKGALPKKGGIQVQENRKRKSRKKVLGGVLRDP